MVRNLPAINSLIGIVEVMMEDVRKNMFKEVRESAQICLDLISGEIQKLGLDPENLDLAGNYVGCEISMKNIIKFGNEPQVNYLIECEGTLRRLRKIKRLLNLDSKSMLVKLFRTTFFGDKAA